MTKKREYNKKLVIESLASVHEAYDTPPRSTLRVGELERIAEKLLDDLAKLKKKSK